MRTGMNMLKKKERKRMATDALLKWGRRVLDIVKEETDEGMT